MNKHFADKLLKGETIQCRPRGSSMLPKIKSGQLVTISPDVTGLGKGDVAFCKVGGKYYVHLVTAVQGERYQISNNKGHVNGWIGKNGLFGKVTKIED
jgi:phage repressor protein C with HTH and peptisase S24 domain